MFMVVITFPGVAALAQMPAPGRNLTNQDESASKKSSLQGTTLEQLHEILRKYPEPHDTYLSIARIGNEETVPLLLERFRLDYGASEPPQTPGVLYGFICTQVHLVDALRFITNTDQGMYYPRWAAWWEENRHFSQHRWILDGFAAAGLHVADQVDEQFGLELIEVMGRADDYRAFNAKRLLANAPPDLRAEWVARASSSAVRFRRLGAVAVLKQIDTTGYEDLLRRLAADSDVEVRRDALTTLNDHLRASLSPSSGTHILGRANMPNSTRSVIFAGDLLIAAFGDGKVQAFDIRTRQTRWTCRVAPGLGDEVLVADDKVVLASQEGDLLSVDRRGRTLWHREAGDRSNEIRRLLRRGDDIVVVRLHSLEQIEAKTGATKSTIPAVDFIRDADSSQTFAFFVDGRGLRSLSNGVGAEHQISDPQGVSVTQESVCVTSGGTEGHVMCLAPDTLSQRWTRSIGRNGTWGHGVAPIQDESRVFVPTDTDLTAFSASDGSLLWTASGGQESHGATVPTGYGLLTQNYNYKLEIRDPTTGEVRRVWPQIQGILRLAVQQQFAAVATINALWLIDLSDSVGLAKSTDVPLDQHLP
jgi:hypothetical protein